MELRFIFIISLVILMPLNATPVKRYPLDDRREYTLRIGMKAPTTVLFPGPITALDGAGVSVRAEDHPDILISHQAGTAFFSARALHPEANGAINAVYKRRVYVITLTADPNPDRALRFTERSSETSSPAAQSSRPDRLLSLLDRAKHFTALAEHYPALAQSIERTSPNTVSTDEDVTITIEEVLRFDEEDALAFRVQLENHGAQARLYSPQHLAVQIGAKSFPVALTNASGQLPAHQAAVVYLIIAGQPGESSAHLSLENLFSILLP